MVGKIIDITLFYRKILKSIIFSYPNIIISIEINFEDLRKWNLQEKLSHSVIYFDTSDMYKTECALCYLP